MESLKIRNNFGRFQSTHLSGSLKGVFKSIVHPSAVACGRWSHARVVGHVCRNYLLELREDGRTRESDEENWLQPLQSWSHFRSAHYRGNRIKVLLSETYCDCFWPNAVITTVESTIEWKLLLLLLSRHHNNNYFHSIYLSIYNIWIFIFINNVSKKL